VKGPRGNGRKIALAGLLAGAEIGVAPRDETREAAPGRHPGDPQARAVTVTTDDGARLAAEVTGAGPVAVVFAHGWLVNRHSWQFQRRALAGLATLVLYDQRGHGRSSPGGPGACTLDRLGDDLAAVIEQTLPPGTPVVLVGHAMGGTAIMSLAARRPGLFGTTIVGAALLSTPPGDPRENVPEPRLAPVIPLHPDRMTAPALRPPAIPVPAVPMANGPIPDGPALDRPRSDGPALDRPLSDESASHRPTLDRPAPDCPAPDGPLPDRPAPDRPASDRALTDGSMPECSVPDRRALERQAWGRTGRFATLGPHATRDHIRFVADLVTAADPTARLRHELLVRGRRSACPALRAVRTLVLVGSADPLTPPGDGRRIAEALPDATLAVVAGAGHLIGLERPDVVNRALRGFVGGCAARTPVRAC
jgi:pimeloyl-ACP methyl ester carboxylesterase